ncbi:MAG: adenylate/guanylate cyclase domain-containing protein [Hyphomicrobiaceae bacterium]
MHALGRGRWDQRLRLFSGLILFSFVLTHFLNHALGLISIDAMEWMQTWRQKVTRSTLGTILLTFALFSHVVLALVRLARRSTLAMPLWEAIQIASGLIIPFLLIPHIVHTRIASTFFRVNDFYIYELLQIWPHGAWDFATLMVLVWIHACIGLHYWLRLSKIYLRILPALYSIAVAIPLLAYAGFTVAGRAAVTKASNPDTFARLQKMLRWPDNETIATLIDLTTLLRWTFGILLALVLVHFLIRYVRRGTTPKVDVDYVHGPTIRTPSGPTLLEISRLHNIPHTSVCGGRARCSTCRVRVESGQELLHPPGAAESKTLAAINAASNVRLACQTRPKSPLTVFRLLATQKTATDGKHETVVVAEEAGIERELVIMFMDVRGFTRWSEGKLPYDVVYILNEFFNAASKIVLDEGGWIDKYMGDGMMAVFGRDVTPEVAAAQSLRAAARIDVVLDDVGAKLSAEVGEEIKIGIGLHAGTVVLVHIGYEDAGSLTVIGEAVNTASRLEGLTSGMSLQLIASERVMQLAGETREPDTKTSTEIRGLQKPIEIFGYLRARVLHKTTAQQVA